MGPLRIRSIDFDYGAWLKLRCYSEIYTGDRYILGRAYAGAKVRLGLPLAQIKRALWRNLR